MATRDVEDRAYGTGVYSEQVARRRLRGEPRRSRSRERDRRSKELWHRPRSEGAGEHDADGQLPQWADSAIKYVGVVGAVLFYAFMITLALFAHRVIMRAKGTELMPVALFFAIPALYSRVYYTVVFGSFDGGMSNSILSLGLLQLVDRALSRESIPAPVVSASDATERSSQRGGQKAEYGTSRVRHEGSLARSAGR